MKNDVKLVKRLLTSAARVLDRMSVEARRPDKPASLSKKRTAVLAPVGAERSQEGLVRAIYFKMMAFGIGVSGGWAEHYFVPSLSVCFNLEGHVFSATEEELAGYDISDRIDAEIDAGIAVSALRLLTLKEAYEADRARHEKLVRGALL